jgi:hypothetical protein
LRIIDATCLMFFSLATDEPPNFNTCIREGLRLLPLLNNYC